ncbi:MAG: YbbR-like domain-containing protein [Bacteroidales bacterium]|nr:YbbR-like domain-containing protein [Bacteroidales bacterium]
MFWLKAILTRGIFRRKGSGNDRDVVIFVFFLLLSFVFWYLNSLEKEVEYSIRYPVRYINLPEERVLADDLPLRLELFLKGPGYSILKLKMSGNRSPVVLDVSSINYRRVPNSRALDYYVVTSGLIPKLRNQLRAECDITSVKPDTLFFAFDRIIKRQITVAPDVEVSTEKQYLVKGNYHVEPDTIEITGPKRILDTLKAVRTKPMKLRGVRESVTRGMSLLVPDKCVLSEKKVLVTVSVEQFTEAEVKVPVRIINCPDSINLRIFPDIVTVKGLVAIGDYTKFEQVPFEVILDAAKADLNSAEKLSLDFRNIPPYVNSMRVSPPKVDFLIERKEK